MNTEFGKKVDDYFDEYFRFHPTSATSAGLHQYDALLENYSRDSIRRQIAFFNRSLAAFQSMAASRLNPQEQADRELVLSDIRSNLLNLQELCPWQRDPDLYSSGISNSLFVIISRNFASPEERLELAIARERKIPDVFREARNNLQNPPRIYTEVAIEQLPGIISFFQNDVPQAFHTVSDKALRADFETTNGAVIHELRAYREYLETTLLKASRGDFRIGEANYRKKLLYDEMVDIPLDRLLEVGYADMRRNQELFTQTAKRLAPNRTPEQILEEMAENHPAPEQLLQAFRDMLEGVRQFVVDREIVTIPSAVHPIVEETPPFARALTFASMDTPGPYETKAIEAYFNVTLPEADMSPERVDSFMAQFNRDVMTAVVIHEVYPGHYVQFQSLEKASSKARKLIGCASNAEGWAHYCEQMVLDEGYGGGDPKLRLGQLQDALLRNARYIAGISMHIGTMRFDEAVEFFQKEGYQTHEVAVREAKRGAADPTYLVYTLGKLEILKLRADYQQQMGPTFNLRQFHDSFLQQGYPPIRLIRQTLLGDNGPVL